MAKEKRFLGQILIDSGKLTPDQLEEALQYHKDHKIYLGQAIVETGLLTEEEFVEVLSEQLQIPSIDPMAFNIENDILKLVKEDLARRLNVIPLFSMDGLLTVACSDPMNVEIVDAISQETGLGINIVMAPESKIEQAIELYYSAEKYIARKEGKEGDRGAVQIISKEIKSDAEIIDTINRLLDEAIVLGSSDIHIEPRERDVRIRFRVDGILQQHYTVSRSSLSSLISRIKILSDMDIAETRKPQDGRFSYKTKRAGADVRSSIFPTSQGEKAVMRILDERRGKIALHKLGFQETALKRWLNVIKNPNGIILVSGPTGCGKTTTLYSTLNIINTKEVNIMTIEDPIEYQIENVNQSNINARAGLDFPTALKSMLRQDPDAMMVGEMRDVETIELSIRAALTGHLVFSTIHTNDTASCYTRILDMGIDAYLVSSTIRAILAQRLIRLLCPRCKENIEATDSILETLNIQKDFEGELFKPVGCVHCKNSGYFGRAAVFELLEPNDEIITMVNGHATAKDIEKVAVANGMITLRAAAMEYVSSGQTSVEEMIRLTLN